MKKTISFKKNLEFPTMIGEVTAISLEHDVNFIDESNIAGTLTVTGRYKMTEASRIEEDFNHQLPVEILLTEKLDLATAKVDIEDFYYEIENDDIMICNIDIKVEGVEIIEELDQEEPVLIDVEEIKNVDDYIEDSQEERCIEEDTEINQNSPTNTAVERECDGEITVEMENIDMSKAEEKKEQVVEMNQGVGSLFSSFKDSDETFSTYSVYILRQEETLQTIIEKYKTTKEELEKYNDLTNLAIGTKIIIPTSNE